MKKKACGIALLLFLAPNFGLADNPFLSAACFRSIESAPFSHMTLTKLPCNLVTGASPSQIVFFGETHDYAQDLPNKDKQEIAKIEDHQKISQFLGKLAKSGQVFLATEGMAASEGGKPFDTLIFGKFRKLGYVQFPIEHELSLALGGLVQFSTFDLLLAGGSEYQSYLNARIRELLRTLWTNAYLQRAWKKVDRPMRGTSAEVLALRVDQLACDKDGYQKIAEWSKTWSTSETAEFVEILRELYRRLTQVAAEINYEKGFSPNFAGLEAVLKYDTFLGANNISLQNTIVRITSDFREEVMVANLATLYCTLASEKRDFAVQVGSLHVPGTVSRLKTMFRNSGLDPDLVKEADLNRIRTLMKDNP